MITKIKYLKDENGEVISPIVDASSIFIMDSTTLDKNIFPIIYINKKVTTTSNTWADVGITSKDITYNGKDLEGINPSIIAHGAYAIMLVVNQLDGTNANGNYSGKNGFWQETGAGIIALYNKGTNSSVGNEIALSWVGHAPNNNTIKLRWLRISNGGNAKLQILTSNSWTEPCNLNFYFRKLI